MASVKFETTALPVVLEENGLLKWSPAIRLGDKKDFMPISHQGQILYYDTPEEAEQYFEE